MDMQITERFLEDWATIEERTTYFFINDERPFQIKDGKVVFYGIDKGEIKVILQECHLYYLKNKLHFICNKELLELQPYNIEPGMSNFKIFCGLEPEQVPMPEPELEVELEEEEEEDDDDTLSPGN